MGVGYLGITQGFYGELWRARLWTWRFGGVKARGRLCEELGSEGNRGEGIGGL